MQSEVLTSTPSNQTLAALMLVLTLLAPGQTFAGEAEWQAHMDEEATAYRAGDSQTRPLPEEYARVDTRWKEYGLP